MIRFWFPLLLLLAAFGVATADEPKIFLSWHQPYGLPGATDTLTLDCGNPARTDTLFMSFDPGITSTSYLGFTAALWFQPLEGDSLESIWESPSATGLPLWMRLEFDPDSASGCPSPLLVSGAGGAAYHRTPDGGRILRMVHAVGSGDTVTVEAGRRYGMARLILRQPSRSPGCRQAVRIRWTESILSVVGGRHRRVEPVGVQVTLNGKPVPAPEPGSKEGAKPAKKH
jgi:hypothetical protein